MGFFENLRREKREKQYDYNRQPEIAVPEDTEVEEDTEKQRAIIVHEMSHIQRWHSADMMLCDFTINMLWWLPVSWMLRNDLRNVHEYEADSCVLASGVDSTLYQQLIIEKATSKSKRTIANNFNQSEVKNRLAVMLRGKSKRKSLLKLL